MIRLSSVAPRFKHGGAGGFALNRSWAEFKSLSATQRELLRDFHGRWIRIHPDDRDELARYGLRFAGGQEPLEEFDARADARAKADAAKAAADAAKAATDAKAANTTTTTTTTTTSTTNAKAEKADEKKKS